MSLAHWIVQNTLLAALLALAVAAACRAGRFSPALRHALWLVVLIKLITPPLVTIPLSLPPHAPGWAAAATAGRSGVVSRSAEDPADSVLLAFERFEVSRVEGQPDGAQTASDRRGGDIVDTAPLLITDAGSMPAAGDKAATALWIGDLWTTILRLQESGWLLRAWLAGTVLFTLVQGMRLINLRRMVSRGGPPDAALQGLVARCAAELRVRPPRVQVVPGLRSPAIYACGRAELLWPQHELADASGASRRAVVLHELAHLRRRDHWAGWLELAAGCGWWWNPLYWFLRRQLHEAAELACDAWVVALQPDGRRAYAEALIAVAAGAGAPQLAGVTWGVGNSSRTLLERRLVMIMRGEVRSQVPLAGLAFVVLGALVALPAWSIGQEPPAPGSTPTADVVAPTDPAAGSPLRASDDPLTPALETPATIGAPARPDPFSALPVPTAGDAVPGPARPAPDVKTPSRTGAASTLGARPAPRGKAGRSAATPSNRLAELEARIRDLQGQIEALRAAGMAATEVPNASLPPPGIAAGNALNASAPATAGDGAGVVGDFLVPVLAADLPTIPPGTGPAVPGSVTTPVDPRPSQSTANGDVTTVTITRALYKLPQARAEAVARFLREQVSEEVEVRVRGDALQVTASEEDQSAVYHLIRLLQRRPSPANPADAFEPISPEPSQSSRINSRSHTQPATGRLSPLGGITTSGGEIPKTRAGDGEADDAISREALDLYGKAVERLEQDSAAGTSSKEAP